MCCPCAGRTLHPEQPAGCLLDQDPAVGIGGDVRDVSRSDHGATNQMGQEDNLVLGPLRVGSGYRLGNCPGDRQVITDL